MQLFDLKVGDKVLASGGGFGRTWRQIETILRVTKTQITTNRERYTRRYGQAIGGGLHATFIEVTTPEQVAEVNQENTRRRLVAAVEKVRWHELSDEKLNEILAIINRK